MSTAGAAWRSALDFGWDEPDGLGAEAFAALVGASADGIVVLDQEHRYVYANPAACALLGRPPAELRGRSFLDGLADRSRPPALERLAEDRCGAPWAAVLSPPAGGEMDVDCTHAVLDFRGRRLVTVFLRDVSERRRQAREAAVLAQAAASVAVSDSVESTVQALAESARAGTRALGAAMVLHDPDNVAAWFGAAGLPEGAREGMRRAKRAGVRFPGEEERALKAQRVVVSPEFRRQLESEPASAPLAESLRPLPWQAAVLAPLVHRGRIVGMLVALYPEGELPSEAETTFLATLADQAAVVAVNARLVAAAQEKVALEERQKLARELHDSVSQALYGIGLGARTARALLRRDHGRVEESIDYITELAAGALVEMRALIFELRPESLETEGLVVALSKQAEALEARYRIAAQVTAGEEPEATFEVKQALYRIAQEAIQNTVKHAHAKRVGIRLACTDGWVVLEIEDDGVGFDTDDPFPGHLGLRSMRERARGVHGTVEVISARGRGTRIVARIPARVEARAG
jgi:PAS domain S-box-containing protein